MVVIDFTVIILKLPITLQDMITNFTNFKNLSYIHLSFASQVIHVS